MSLSSTTFGGLITFTRPSTATRTGPTGLVETIATDQPRFDYNTITLAAKGLLIEESRTNLFTNSVCDSNSVWGKGVNMTRVGNTTAPDGTNTATIYTTTSTSNAFINAPVALAANTTYTVSVYAKLISGSVPSSGTLISVDYDSDNNSTTVERISLGFTGLNSTWQRFSLTFTNVAANTNSKYFATDFGNGAQIAFWGAQIEVGSYATSYIPTVSAAVTRAADVASINTLNPWFNAAEGTLYIEVDYLGLRSDGSISTPFMLYDGTGNNQISLRNGTIIVGTDLYVMSSSSTQVDTNSTTTVANTKYKHAIGYKLNDYAFSTNGATALTDTAANVPTVTKLAIGSNNFCGHIQALKYYPKRLTNTELQALTI